MTDDRREDVRRLEDQDLATRIDNVEGTVAKLLDVLLGAEDTWGVRQHQKGLVHKVERIDDRLTNGGVRVRLPAGLWVLLITLTTSAGGIVVALINRPPSLP